ncbi:partial Dihydrolipoyllysine-residue acetyltransferase component of pyruvate dehydrogenase complex, partial [Gammaproteobacteria bacterium]
MATKVFMEALSPTMEEGRLVKWLKAEGDAVKSGETLAEVETDKAIMELVARGDGVLRKRLIAEGATSPVGSLIAVIAGADEDIASLVAGAAAGGPPPAADATAPPAPTRDPQNAPPATATQATTAPASGPTPSPVPAPAQSAPPPSSSAASAGRLRSSPLARRLAAERGVDLGSIGGSGPGGRIIKRDVESAPAAAGTSPA